MRQYRQQENPCDDPNESPSGEWCVVKRCEGGIREMIEGDLPEEIARQMVADYAAEGETVWMQRTAPAPE